MRSTLTNGRKLWGQKIGGAIGGGVITYTAGGTQKVAVATGLTEVLWPTETTTARVSILGLDGWQVRAITESPTPRTAVAALSVQPLEDCRHQESVGIVGEKGEYDCRR